MKIKSSLKGIFFYLISLFPWATYAQPSSTIKEYEKAITTYPFSEPDPVPNATGVYPYFRYDGFTDKPIQKKWKVVELDNDFIKIIIMPQIGGKIWTAIDKKNGQPFIYDNDAIKFRDIAERGPWTSGGIEPNYGMFGHTPGVATPVNYLTRKNADGSVSCIISLLDLLTRTRWSLEIRLPKDKAYFITKSVWHNSTPIYQPYYTWMNLGEKVSDSLEYIFPGNHYIYHDGKVYSFPYNKENHKHISIYNQNDFGGPKSYHVTGVYSNYYGAFWRKQNFGMIHYAERQDKIGKKIWIWRLSRQGMIWEKILTDHSGQYTEIQSGRLYNQNAPESVFSPFKQFYFMPYNTDIWSEYWYPFQNTDGVADADLNGVFNVKYQHDKAILYISPVSYIHDTLKVWGKSGHTIFIKIVNLQPLQSFKQEIPLKDNEQIGKIILARSIVNLQNSTEKILDRPLESDSDFNWESAYGLFMRGRYEAGTHHYKEAEKFIDSSLKKEPYFIPALTTMSYLQYREMNYDSAYYYARKALSIDTYNPAANYYYGLAALKLNKWFDALDGFQVATITPEFRSAAYTGLSKMKIQNHRYEEAYQYAKDALVNNAENITALQLQYVAAQYLQKIKSEEEIKGKILTLDPLNNFIRFEEYWQNKTATEKEHFTSLIRDELPQQTYLHLADWYIQLGMDDEAETVLQTAPQRDDEMKYWLAYLHRNDEDASQWLDSANAGTPLFVFPFRKESYTVMQWASQQTDNWKPQYYLALLDTYFGRKKEAEQILEKIAPESSFAPLYVTLARIRNSSDTTNILNDYEKAVSLNKADWRYGKYLTEYLLEQKKYHEALLSIQPYFKKSPENYIAGMLYVRCLMRNDQYPDAEKILDNIHVLPYEGATDGHLLYKQVKLMLALQLLQRKQYQAALKKVSESREWPESLGEGKPYPDMIHDTLQNDIERFIRNTMQNKKMDNVQINIYRKKVEALNRKNL